MSAGSLPAVLTYNYSQACNRPSFPNASIGNPAEISVDRVAAAPDVAYVFGAAGTGAHLWRRTETTWTKITSFPALNISQAWYDWYVAAPPDNSGRVYLGAIDTIRGDLTGSTRKWTNVTTHGEQRSSGSALPDVLTRQFQDHLRRQ